MASKKCAGSSLRPELTFGPDVSYCCRYCFYVGTRAARHTFLNSPSIPTAMGPAAGGGAEGDVCVGVYVL